MKRRILALLIALLTMTAAMPAAVGARSNNPNDYRCVRVLYPVPAPPTPCP